MPDIKISPQAALDQFREAIAQKGITPPNTIETDGKLHRFSTNGRPGDDAGWYVFHEGDVPAGAFGDFRSGQSVPYWVADIGRPLSLLETVEIRKQQTENTAERAAKDRQLQAEARNKAYRIIRNTVPASSDHPYLVRKNVASHGLSVWDDANVSIGHSRKDNKPILQIASPDGSVQIGFKVKLGDKTEEEFLRPWRNILIVPMMDDKGTVQSLQFISENGDKKFLYGGKMQGSYFTLGNLKDSETVLIAEGYATAATIHEITGHPVVVAYNAGNLLEVSQSIRAQKFDADIVLCADDDWKTSGNPGLTKAREAARAINGRVVSPEFGPDRPDGATDFNDMAAHSGKAAVTVFFTRHFSERNKAMTNAKHHNDNEKAFFSRPDLDHASVAPSNGRIFTGKISGFGPAPYKNDAKNGPSYFITLGDGENARTIWGVDLGKALHASGFTVGDEVAIYDKGKVPVQIMKKVHDANGNIVGQEPQTVMKGSWHIGSLEDYVESRLKMAQESVEREKAATSNASQETNDAAVAGETIIPRTESAVEALPQPKAHFAENDFEAVQKIWKDVPRKTAQHSESGYHILIDNKRKIHITKDRIELARKARHRPDEAYKAACEHACHFWNGQMEIQGDRQHRIKAWAYATAYGVQVTNYTPADSELIEAEKLLGSLREKMEPAFRPPSVRAQSTKQRSAKLDA